jgi:hypothetical protein
MIEPPETPHHTAEHHRTAIKWFDVAMAVAVLVVSFGSLYVSLHTGHTMEALVEQNQRLVRAQSTPILQYTHGNNDEGRQVLTFHVRNAGTGPARIAWIRLAHGGKIYRNWTLFALDQVQGVPNLPLMSSPIAPAVLSAGEERMILRWERGGGSVELAAWDRIEQARFTDQATACYCSVFDECWTSHMNGDVPQQVESCEVPRPVISRRTRGH